MAAPQMLSLAGLMSKLEMYDRKHWIHKEKAILAVILAYSLLQLHDSPWSQSHWNSDNIAFIDNGLVSRPRASAGVHLELRRPYTRSQVTVSAPASHTGSAATHTNPSRPNAHLHALGVVLLELYLNRSIQSEVSRSGQNDFRSVAQDLLEGCADDIGMTAEYLNAIRFCLSPRPSPVLQSFSFEDEDFRELYYQDVIAMLEENLETNFMVSEKVWMNTG